MGKSERELTRLRPGRPLLVSTGYRQTLCSMPRRNCWFVCNVRNGYRLSWLLDSIIASFFEKINVSWESILCNWMGHNLFHAFSRIFQSLIQSCTHRRDSSGHAHSYSPLVSSGILAQNLFKTEVVLREQFALLHHVFTSVDPICTTLQWILPGMRPDER